MLEENRDILHLQSPNWVPASSDEAGRCTFRPDSYTELVIHLLREYSSLGVRENGGPRSLDPGQLRPAMEMID